MANEFLDRLKLEQQELLEKVTKLAMFLASDKIEMLTIANKLLLNQQLVHMNDYLNILTIRIELIK